MMANKEIIIDLLNSLDQSQPDAQKLDEFVKMIGDSENADECREVIALMLQHQDDMADSSVIDKIWITVKQDLPQHAPIAAVHRTHLLRTAWFRYAAAVLLVIGLVAYFWNNQHYKKTDSASSVALADIKPGGERAILSLSDGREIILNTSVKTITDTDIDIQNNNGELSYGKATRAVFNTMSTPRGAQYTLALPDGSRVFLNAASSITYPTAFTGGNRTVKIMGEAFFDIATDKNKPFIVETPTEIIQVLGTPI